MFTKLLMVDLFKYCIDMSNKKNFRGFFDWNSMHMKDHINHLKEKIKFSRTGDAKSIYELIKDYERLTEKIKEYEKIKDTVKMDVKKTRDYLYKIIDGERRYQEGMKKENSRPDIIEDFHMGDTIAAMQFNLNKARETWYKNSTPHHEAMEYIRKICALGIQAGENFGMPNREERNFGECDMRTESGVCAMDSECICKKEE